MAHLGPFLYKTNYGAASPDLGSPELGGFALIAEGDVNNHGGLEIGIFYLHKLYFRKQDSEALAEKVKQIYVTMGYRHWLGTKFSLAAALFSSYTMGDYRVIHSSFNPPNRADTSAQDTTEYGFDFSLQYEFWGRKRWAAVVDTRYSLSVTNKFQEDGDHYGVLVALKYLVQQKDPF